MTSGFSAQAFALAVASHRSAAPGRLGSGKAVLPVGARLVAMALALHASNASGLAWPSVRRLEALTGLKRTSVARALAELEQAGLIEVDGALGRGVARWRLVAGMAESPGQPEATPSNSGNSATGVVQRPQSDEATGVVQRPQSGDGDWGRGRTATGGVGGPRLGAWDAPGTPRTPPNGSEEEDEDASGASAGAPAPGVQSRQGRKAGLPEPTPQAARIARKAAAACDSRWAKGAAAPSFGKVDPAGVAAAVQSCLDAGWTEKALLQQADFIGRPSSNATRYVSGYFTKLSSEAPPSRAAAIKAPATHDLRGVDIRALAKPPIIERRKSS